MAPIKKTGQDIKWQIKCLSQYLLLLGTVTCTLDIIKQYPEHDDVWQAGGASDVELFTSPPELSRCAVCGVRKQQARCFTGSHTRLMMYYVRWSIMPLRNSWQNKQKFWALHIWLLNWQKSHKVLDMVQISFSHIIVTWMPTRKCKQVDVASSNLERYTQYPHWGYTCFPHSI